MYKIILLIQCLIILAVQGDEQDVLKKKALKRMEAYNRLFELDYEYLKLQCKDEPKNFDDAVRIIQNNLPLSILYELEYKPSKLYTKTQFYIFWAEDEHHGLGRFIRNTWIHGKTDTPLLRDFTKKNITHHDTMSDEILKKIAKNLISGEFKIKDAIELKLKLHKKLKVEKEAQKGKAK